MPHLQFFIRKKNCGYAGLLGAPHRKKETAFSQFFLCGYDRSFADDAFLPCNTRLLRKYLLRSRLSYGESKRAGNGWRVCRTDNFASSKIVVRGLLGAPYRKRTEFASVLFLYGAPNRTRTYDTAVNSRMLYRLSYRGICDSEYYIIISGAICQAFFYQIKQFFTEKFLLRLTYLTTARIIYPRHIIRPY